MRNKQSRSWAISYDCCVWLYRWFWYCVKMSLLIINTNDAHCYQPIKTNKIHSIILLWIFHKTCFLEIVFSMFVFFFKYSQRGREVMILMWFSLLYAIYKSPPTVFILSPTMEKHFLLLISLVFSFTLFHVCLASTAGTLDGSEYWGYVEVRPSM